MNKGVNIYSPEAKAIFEKRAAMRAHAEANKRGAIVAPITKRDSELGDIIKDGCWSGRRCFIIGGGPSLRDFDFSSLQDDITIGINAAYTEIDPTIMFSMDKRFFEWASTGKYGKTENDKSGNLLKYNESNSIKMHLNVEPLEIKGVYNIRNAGDCGLSKSLSAGLYNGENSGYAALNLAYILGCNPIYLLGFDLNTNERYHWHDGHPGQNGTGEMSTFLKAFVENAPAILSKTKVINLNRKSMLKCFEFGDMPKIEKKPVVIIQDKGASIGLKNQLKRHGIRHRIVTGDFTKQEAIKNSMEALNRDIVYLDDNAVISEYPEEIFKFKGDFGIFKNLIPVSRELAGLTYIKNSPNGKKLLSEWELKGDISKALKSWSGKVGYFIRKNEVDGLSLETPDEPKYKNIKHNKSWILISYYTTGTSYETEIQKLIKSLSGFKIDYCIFGKPPLGSWRKNLDHKSEVILQAMEMFPNKDVVFVDSDAIINKQPDMFDQLSKEKLYDIAAAFHTYYQSVSTGSLLSGTLWISNNEMGKTIVNRWHQIGLKNPEVRHQHCLRLAIDEIMMSGNLFFIFRLPTAYTFIFDYNYGQTIYPVITHYQASRKLRKEVGESALRDSNFTAKQGGYNK